MNNVYLLVGSLRKFMSQNFNDYDAIIIVQNAI